MSVRACRRSLARAARWIEDAITRRSDLDAVRTQARVLTALTEPDALRRLRPYFRELAVAARRVADAGDVVAAANSAATLVHQCGHCHAALAVAIKFPDEPRPSDDVWLAPRMLDIEVGHVQAGCRALVERARRRVQEARAPTPSRAAATCADLAPGLRGVCDSSRGPRTDARNESRFMARPMHYLARRTA